MSDNADNEPSRDGDISKVVKTPLLQFETGSLVCNYCTWLEPCTAEMTLLYHEQASCLMEQNKAFVPSWEMPEGTLPADASQGIKDMYLAEYHKSRSRLIFSMQNKAKAFMHSLLDTVHKTSRDLIKTHGKYTETYAAGDPNGMFLIIREMHFTKIGANHAGASNVLEKLQLERNWGKFKQLPGMSLLDYYEKFKNWQLQLEAWGIPLKTGEELGADYIDRLDPGRFAEFQLKLMNDVALSGASYPKTLFLANNIASKYKVLAPQPAANQSGGAAKDEQRSFVLCHEVIAPASQRQLLANRDSGGPGPRVKGDVRPGDVELDCFNCTEIGHVSVNCPHPPRTEKGRKALRRRKPKTEKQTPQPEKEKQPTVPPKSGLKGPRREDKQQPANKALYSAQGEHDSAEEEDEEEAYNRAFITSKRSYRMERVECDVLVAEAAARPQHVIWTALRGVVTALWFIGCALFALLPTCARSLFPRYVEEYEEEERRVRIALLATDGIIEITLDSAASSSLFRSDFALTGIKALDRPYLMKGVERGSKGIRVGSQGTFEDLGVVDYCEDAVADILSHAELKDKGFSITYDDARDLFVVTASETRVWIFERKTMRNGRKTRFYTHDLHTRGMTILNMACDREEDYTVREVRAG